jgi:hypothetical protein
VPTQPLRPAVGHALTRGAGDVPHRYQAKQTAPDASTIKVAGDWLLKNVPALTGALTSLFVNPIVGKVVEAAGDLAAKWVKERLGTSN